MTWSSILPLAGVALGSTGTLVGQYLITRVDVRRERRERVTAERAERKETILAFLSAVQTVELLLDRSTGGRPLADDDAWDHLHDLWLAKKSCELVCSADLAQAAHDYTLTLHGLLRSESASEEPAAKRERRYAFMEAARRELGVDGAPLRRSPPLAGTTTEPAPAAARTEGSAKDGSG